MNSWAYLPRAAGSKWQQMKRDDEVPLENCGVGLGRELSQGEHTRSSGIYREPSLRCLWLVNNHTGDVTGYPVTNTRPVEGDSVTLMWVSIAAPAWEGNKDQQWH